MPDLKKKRVTQSSESLTKFLNTLPIDQRKSTATVLYKIRKELNDVIPPKGSIKLYLAQIAELRSVFIRLPLSVRCSLKTVLLEALASTLETSPLLFALLSTCLCLLELVAVRNCDRMDLEAQDVHKTVSQLNQLIIPNLTQKVQSLRTNMPRIEAWSLGLILFTYQACIKCLSHQIACSSIADKNQISGFELHYDPTVVTHTCMPVVLNNLLQSQSKGRSFPIPPPPYTLFDLVFSCSISNNYEMLSRAKPAPLYSPDMCPLEFFEPAPSKRPRTSQSDAEALFPSKLPTVDVADLSAEELEVALKTGTKDHVLSMLRGLVHSSAKSGKSHGESTPAWVAALKCTPYVLLNYQRDAVSAHKSKDVTPDALLYEQVHGLLLQLWCRASEQRTLLTGLPQSYLWLTGLVHPRYECMTVSGFLCSVVWLSRFLTAYQSLFRAAILASPHWYLQAIADVVVAVIDRLDRAAASEATDELEDTMCACLVAIGRPYSALGVDESDIRPELSRVIKVPLELIVSRMAVCRSSRNVDTGGQAAAATRPVLGPRLREILASYLLYPMIKAMDPWALGQTVVGLRPATAKVLVKQLISDAQLSDDSWEGARLTERLSRVKKPVAIGGLHIADKLTLKRRR